MASRLRKQAPWIIIIIVATAAIISLGFAILYTLQINAQKAHNTGSYLDSRGQKSGLVPTRNTIAIVYTDKPNYVQRFDLTLTVLNHTLVSDSEVDTQIQVVDSAGESTDLQFTELEQVIEWNGYVFRLRTALDTSMQIVIGEADVQDEEIIE